MKGREEEKKSRGRERKRRDGKCLSKRETEKRENSGWKLKISLSQQMGEGVGMACLLKRQDNHYNCHGMKGFYFEHSHYHKIQHFHIGSPFPQVPCK